MYLRLGLLQQLGLLLHIFLCGVVLRHDTLQPRCGRSQRLWRRVASVDRLMICLRRLESSMVLSRHLRCSRRQLRLLCVVQIGLHGLLCNLLRRALRLLAWEHLLRTG